MSENENEVCGEDKLCSNLVCGLPAGHLLGDLPHRHEGWFLNTRLDELDRVLSGKCDGDEQPEPHHCTQHVTRRARMPHWGPERTASGVWEFRWVEWDNKGKVVAEAPEVTIAQKYTDMRNGNANGEMA